jgi:hypothetical protein
VEKSESVAFGCLIAHAAAFISRVKGSGGQVYVIYYENQGADLERV